MIVEKISKAEAMRLFSVGTTVAVSRMWKRTPADHWLESDIPMRLSEPREIETVQSRQVVTDTGSRIDVYDAERITYYETRWDRDVYRGPFVRLYWENVAIEYAIGA